MVVSPGDRVSAVIDRDERAVEVLAAASPHFARLRSPAVRRVMARLVTVEQAARIAGIDPAALVARLNRALGGDTADGAPPPSPGVSPSDLDRGDGMPPHLAALPADRVVDLDVREELRAGREPFSRIMAARRALPEGAVLRLRAVFEPVPLYPVMEKQGLAHWTERLADDDWRVWFHPPVAAGGGAGEDAGRFLPPGPSSPGGAGAARGVAVLDVRGLEPPEPMMRTLAALEALAPGESLLQVNERLPRFLLPQVERRGFTWEVQEEGPARVLVLFRRPDPPTA